MPQQRILRAAAGLSYWFKCRGLEPGGWGYEVILRGALGSGRRLVRAVRAPRKARSRPDAGAGQGAGFATRRGAMVAALNAQCDAVLCVSDAVRDIALSHGLAPDLCQTCYIGSDQSDAWTRSGPRRFPQRSDGTLTLAYLGYMRADKGFGFLLEALAELPQPLTSRLRLVVAARRGPAQMMAQLEALRPRLAELIWHDGYTHAGLDDLLGGVDVGLVPALWPDNLPQVAIEIHARHIPLLCSDRGGARELAGAPDMVFAAGDVADFGARLAALLDGQVDLEAYWAGARAPQSMAAHLVELAMLYDSSRSATKGTSAQGRDRSLS